MIDPEKLEETQKEIKRRKKQKAKKLLEYKKKLDEIQELEYRLPPIQVKHDKLGNYNININV